MFKRGSLKKESAVNGFGREDIQNKKGNYGKQKRKPFFERISFFSRCLAESNRSTRFCRPLPNRSVKTPCSVATSFLISECKGTAFILFHQIFYQLFSIFFEFLS